jgi:hypothetical protein
MVINLIVFSRSLGCTTDHRIVTLRHLLRLLVQEHQGHRMFSGVSSISMTDDARRGGSESVFIAEEFMEE